MGCHMDHLGCVVISYILEVVGTVPGCCMHSCLCGMQAGGGGLFSLDSRLASSKVHMNSFDFFFPLVMALANLQNSSTQCVVS